ncbi:MAG: hypothetical protein NTY45_05355 [Elusimicrobia bacterium]|nr:hypothetical protein [Elusimicrobiota bacterium]
MKTKIAISALIVVIAAVFTFTRPTNPPPPDLRDAVADEIPTFGGNTPASGGDVGRLPVSKASAANGKEAATYTGKCLDPTDPDSEYVKKFIRRFDAREAFGNAEVLLVPDDHTKRSIKAALIRFIPILKSQGYTHLALEFLPSKANVDAMDRRELRNFLISYIPDLKKDWPVEPYVELIMTARAGGMKVAGINFDPDAKDAQYNEISGRRDIFNAGDAFMASRIISLRKKYPGAKTVVLAGMAHVSAFYEKNEPNTRIPGELIYRGINERQVRPIYIYTHDFPDRSPVSGVIRRFFKWGDSYLPLPRGTRPNCAEIEAKSMLDGIVFAKE